MFGLRTIFLAVLLLCGLAGSAAAQRIEVRGRGEPTLDRILHDLAARTDYTLITETRLIGRGDTLVGPVIVARATVRLEGTILGDLIGLDANLFLRPTAVVTGAAVNIAGGFYPSELATIQGATHDAPNAPYTVTIRDDVIVVAATDTRPRIEREGFRGVLVPSYDRVDGLTVGAGARLVLPYLDTLDPQLRGRIEFRSERRALTGGLELAARRAGLELAAGAERTTITNESWTRPRWANSLSFLLLGNDYYDHYGADRVYGAIRVPATIGDLTTSLAVRGQLEEAASLPAGDPWSLFGRSARRPNRPVDDGRIVSGILDGSVAYDGATLIARVGGGVELGRASLEEPRLPADFAPPPGAIRGFARYEAWLDLVMAGLLNHSLEIDARFQGPLPGTDELPRQRWTMVGGDRALYTRAIGEFHGDRLAWVHTMYAIPFPEGIRIPVLGPPTLDLIHVAAMAWSHQQSRSLEQNVAVRLRAAVFFVRYAVDPAATERNEFSVGITAPSLGRPWQRRAP